MKKISLLVFLCYFLFSCSGIEQKAEKAVTKKIERDYKVELNQYFSANYDSITANSNFVKLDTLKWVDSLYIYTKHTTIWINDSIQLSERGKHLIDAFIKAKNYGLDTGFYAIDSLLEIKKRLEKATVYQHKYTIASQLETMLSYYYMRYGKHLNYGVLNAVDSVTVLPRKKFAVNLANYLYKASQSDSIVEKLWYLQPKQIEYHNLQIALEKFLKQGSLSTENVIVKNFRIDSLKAIKQAKKALVLHQYLPKKHKDSLYTVALAKFQKDHGLKADGLIGKNTARALSISPYKYYKQLVINLERWRWREPWSSNRIYVNIPSYKMEMYRKDKQVKKHKVVVGKIKNQTPEIIDTLEYIIAYPYWNVPRKISIKEILGKVKRDSTYLVRNNYEVLTYGRKNLNLDSINWKTINKNNFRFLIRQKGGRSNALGLVKFIFPNKHAIYLHDTPSKYFFSKEIRAYSHGCVRVHKALDLAAYILKSDENKYTIDSVYNYIKKERQKTMVLNTKIPIYLYYFTASADSLGTVTFYRDIYKKDDTLIAELASKRK